MYYFHTSLLLLIPIQFCKASKFCDDGKVTENKNNFESLHNPFLQQGIEIDLHGDKDWKCPTTKWTENDINPTESSASKCYDDRGGYHVCIDNTIDDKYPNIIPNRGAHRPVWAKYGEYKYLPPGRYVHNVEHGAVVFMYHPCVPDSMIDLLRRLAVSCLNRHIITAFRNLTKEYPIAVVTYGCVYETNKVNPGAMKDWIRSQYVQNPSPEANEYKDGLYDYGLIKPSQNIERPDTAESYCLDTVLDNTPLLLPTIPPSTIKPRSTANVKAASSTTKSISAQQYKLTNTSILITENHPDPAYEAKWAVACLLFLLIILIIAVWQSKMWRTNYADHFEVGREKSEVYVNGRWKKTVSLKSLVKKLPNVFQKKQKNRNYKLLDHNNEAVGSEDEIY